MATSSDSFELLLKSVTACATHCRDILALLGIFYTAKQGIKFLRRLYTLSSHHVLPTISSESNYPQRFGKWAAVTGCTAGIGAEYCYGLAQRGMNVLLISRNKEKLSELANNIQTNFGVETKCIVFDFDQPDVDYREIEHAVHLLDIGILVNNVGIMYDFPDKFLNVSTQKLTSLVNINVSAATMMTHIVLPTMVARGRGAVITMSSLSGVHPLPLMTVYSATKAYLDYFMRGLEYEYRNSGVTFQTIIPSYVSTGMLQYSEQLSRGGLLVPPPRTIVAGSLNTLGRINRTTAYWVHTIWYWVSNALPEWLWLFCAYRLNSRFKAQTKKRVKHLSGQKTD